MRLAHTSDGAGGALGCAWCEERGWYLGRGDDRSAGGFAHGFTRLRRLGAMVVPPPVVIAEQLARAVATIHPILDLPSDEQPYRASGDNNGLRACLAAYTPPDSADPR